MGVTHRAWTKRPPKNASYGTEPVGSGACEASHAPIFAARSRSVPVPSGAPNSAVAHAVHRREDDHRSGETKPRAAAALTRARVAVADVRA